MVDIVLSKFLALRDPRRTTLIGKTSKALPTKHLLPLKKIFSKHIVDCRIHKLLEKPPKLANNDEFRDLYKQIEHVDTIFYYHRPKKVS